MPKYNYRAADNTGKESKGIITAENRMYAMEELKHAGLFVISMAEQSVLTQDVSLRIMEKRPSARDLAIFCHQFVSIINAGVSIISTLEMLSEQTENKMLGNALSEIKRNIERGETLAGSMREHKKVFSSIFITMVEAGEASGSLDISFERMGTQLEKEAHLKGLMKKASIYPAVVGVVSLAVIIGMLLFVVPTFQTMFEQMNVELPTITKVVIAMSSFVQAYLPFLLLGMFGIIMGIRVFVQSEHGKLLLGQVVLKLPLFGNLVVKTMASHMSRTLSTLLAAGIPMAQALEITANTLSNPQFREALLEARESVIMGTMLAEPLEKSALFPPLVHHMIRIGEETGSMDNMLTTLANFYDDEVELATQSLMAALEPMIIILLAVIIGTIVISVILPMSKLYASFDSL